MLRRLSFNFWYYFHPPWDRGISPPELFDFISHHPPGRAIDLGCGTGTNVITLVQHGWQVTGIDFAPHAVQLAKRKMRHAGVSADVAVGDVTKLEGITGPFDLALDLGCFHGMPSHAEYLAQLSRVLAPHGYWLMYGILRSDKHPSGPGITLAELALVNSSGFELLSRSDGFNRGDRPSAWFLFQHRPPAQQSRSSPHSPATH